MGVETVHGPGVLDRREIGQTARLPTRSSVILKERRGEMEDATPPDSSGPSLPESGVHRPRRDHARYRAPVGRSE